jgi:hypothetical protein
MDERSENSYFTTRVMISEDKRLFICINPADPQRLSILGTGAKIYFAISEVTSVEEAETLSGLINELSRQLLIVIDRSHPLFLSPTIKPLTPN